MGFIINKVSTVHLINNNINSPYNKKLLFSQWHEFENDDYLQEWFLQVLRNLFRFYIKDDYLYHNQVMVRHFFIPTVTRLGKQNNTELIKQMDSNNHVYEARIKESEYDHPRMLFFPCNGNSSNDNLMEPSAVFTFFFVKIKDGTKDKQTQPLINETGSVRQKYFIEQFDKEIIGYSITQRGV